MKINNEKNTKQKKQGAMAVCATEGETWEKQIEQAKKRVICSELLRKGTKGGGGGGCEGQRKCKLQLPSSHRPPLHPQPPSPPTPNPYKTSCINPAAKDSLIEEYGMKQTFSIIFVGQLTRVNLLKIVNLLHHKFY